MRENIIFTFPGISVTAPHSTSAVGLLILSSSSQQIDYAPAREDIYLRLRHTPDSEKGSDALDVLIEAWRELRKTSPREFVLATEFGDITISFPELHHLIPQNDTRIDLPLEAKAGMTWEVIVREFEAEVDRFVSYRKNSYSLLDAPFGAQSGKAREAEGIKPYNPGAYPNEKAGGSGGSGGRLVLVDEENGAEVGEVGGMQVATIDVVPGSKDPVEITFPTEGESGPVTVRTADYLKDASHPMYQNSSLVQTAATASRLIVTTSAYISNAMTQGAQTFAERTKPNTTPTTFQPSTHERFQQVHTLTSTAAKFSSVAVGKVSQLAQNAGAKLAGKDKPQTRGKPRDPNILNKSLIAFSTVADSIDYASKSLLNSTSQAATQMVTHKYGAEAGELSKNLTGSVKNVGLVYIDASGVSRRAVVKGVAKGMVVGKVRGGGEVIVPGNGEKVDGLPYGWGDGPLGGAHAGPPSGRITPGQTSHTPPPPGYTPAGYPTSGEGSNSMYFAPPPRALTSPAAVKNGYPNDKPKNEKSTEFRF
ncbi:senescence-associated protein-domain-containing protein [Tricharina praecox]|uniref:senescence-associated protein-domain-containing protein n=1 Tax=Tricharina praecox TaxID=43433 RepID=UPI002220E3FF|nr:senescence-associated protein-domain-containing protein [Tricharina praecox]KAI5842840.1 senescence-associated protein-domain-containing protein [Tricharina praecox]